MISAIYSTSPIFFKPSLCPLTEISRSVAQLLLPQPHHKVHLNRGIRKPRSANQPTFHSFWLSHTPCHHHQLDLDMDSRSASQLEQIWQCCITGSSPVDAGF